MPVFETSEAEAEKFHKEHGEFVFVHKDEETESWLVALKKGAKIFVPKALNFNRSVAGQIPTGWSAERFGIPKAIVDQVDPVTLFTLVSTVESLISSGITDPYEFYNYIHVSELGNCIGGGMGGARSLQKMYKGRFQDVDVQKDILQETFINTMPAWINLLLFSASGPIKTPVGACAVRLLLVCFF